MARSVFSFSFCFFCLLLYVSALAQPAAGVQPDTSKTEAVKAAKVVADPLLNELVEKQKRINEKNRTMPGYRVQLYFGTHSKATEMKSDFLKKHPDVNIYILYHEPNFKVRVGDFRTRLEAKKFLRQIAADFSAAYIVKDEVALPEIP